jgi:hypothetical protein
MSQVTLIGLLVPEDYMRFVYLVSGTFDLLGLICQLQVTSLRYLPGKYHPARAGSRAVNGKILG